MWQPKRSWTAGAPALLAFLGLTLSNVAVSVAGEQAAADKHPLGPALELARESHEAISGVKDYEAEFLKREVVGRKVSTHKMRIKVRHEPFSVYLWFFEPQGREVIYVDGKNDGKMLVHEVGVKSIVGTVSLAPDSPTALAESRHPITNIGMANLVKKVIDQWEDELKFGECNVQYYPGATFGDIQCKVIESSHPQPRKEFKFHMTRLYIDKKTGFPFRVEQYGFPSQAGGTAPLIEEYTYTGVKADAGLKDIDFDTRNPKYGY